MLSLLFKNSLVAECVDGSVERGATHAEQLGKTVHRAGGREYAVLLVIQEKNGKLFFSASRRQRRDLSVQINDFFALKGNVIGD